MSEEGSEDVAKFAGPRKEAPFLPALFCPCDRDYITDEEQEKMDPHFAHFVEEHQEQPGVLWFSFFSDLIYVCVIVKFTEQYKHFVESEEMHPSAHAGHWFEVRLTLELMLYFLAFFTIWLELVQIKARFYDLPGMWDDILQFVFLVGVVWMAIQMDATTYLLDNKEGFIIGYTICCSAMFILHLLYYGAIADSRGYVTRRLIGYGLVIPVLAGLICMDQFFDFDNTTMEWATITGIIVCCLILLSIAFISFRVMSEYNYAAEFFGMRFGMLTMIIIGESMLACIIGNKNFGFVHLGGAASSGSSAAATVISSAASAAASYVTTDATLAPDAEITDKNVLEFLKNYETPELALAASSAASVAASSAASAASSVAGSVASSAGSVASSYLLNSKGYYIYDHKGAFFQGGGDSNLEDYIGVFLAFGTLYLLKNIYFGSHNGIADDALRNENTPGSVWYLTFHVPMYFFLLTGGAGFRLIFSVIHSEQVYEGYVMLLVMSIALAITFMIMLRLAIPPDQGNMMSFGELVLRLGTVFVLSSLVIVFLDEPIPLMSSVFVITSLSWIYDLIFPPIKDHDDDDYEESEESSDCWMGLLTICGLAEACGFSEDKEYKGNFTGPKEEGNLIDLIEDVMCCRLCGDPAPIPDHFSNEYAEEITKDQHHGHGGHGEHGHGEAGADHGMFGEFTDLIYVAVVIKFADQMKYKQSTLFQADDDLVDSADDRFRIYFEAAVFFMCFFYTWLELTHCLIRFKNMPGIFDDVMFFCYLSGVVGMAVNLNHLEFLTERRLAFCSWFAFALGSLTILHLFYWQINDAERYVERRLPWFGFSAITALVAGFLPPEYCLAVLLVAVVVPLCVSVNSYRVWDGQKFSKHEQMHYVERFGLIIMITIGESVLALVLLDFERKLEFYIVVFSAFATMYLILQNYIRSDSDARSHALAEGEICGSILWVCFHGIAAYFLLTMGVGYKMILPYADTDSVGEVNRYTLCYSLAGVLGCFIMIRAAHNLYKLTVTTFIVRAFVAGSAVVAAHFLEHPIYITTVCLGVVLVTGLLDIIFIDVTHWEIEDEDYAKIYGKGEGSESLLHSKGSGSATYSN